MQLFRCHLSEVDWREATQKAKEEIVVILCDLEMYLPPAFFDVMVLLLVHIMEDIIQLGMTFLHSMMSFERMNGVIKGYVRNMSRPEESIARGFLTEECISYCTNYLGIENPVGLPSTGPSAGSLDGVIVRVSVKCMSTSRVDSPTLKEQT